jgi:hypothetical protein
MAKSSTARTRNTSRPARGISFSEYTFANRQSLGVAHQRTIAIATGDLHLAINREIRRLLRENNGDALLVTKIGLDHLLSDGLITSSEVTSLSTICDTVVATHQGKLNSSTASYQVRWLYDQLLADDCSSPIAISITSLVSSAYNLALSISSSNEAGGAADNASRPNIGMVGGAIIGGVIGTAMGGHSGAIIGTVVGGIAGGVYGLCSE